MFAVQDTTRNGTELRSVETLTAGGMASDLGLLIGGSRSGPNVLVTGYRPVSDKVFDRLLALPTLPWLRGRLYLLRLEELSQVSAADEIDALAEVAFDRTLILPLRGRKSDPCDIAEEGYRRVLRLCAELGMIEGRGVY